MNEPTREQIKEAFKKTIERWERIVEDVDYFNDSACALCLLESPDGERYVCGQSCPIRPHTKEGLGSCSGTPYNDFFNDKTPANALAELNFLRKVYIWWMEEEEKDSKWEALTGYVKEEKREEWVDVTGEITWITENYKGATLPYLLYGTYLNGDKMAYVNKGGFQICSGHEDGYKVEQHGQTFRILKKT